MNWAGASVNQQALAYLFATIPVRCGDVVVTANLSRKYLIHRYLID
jgi:hypothetical protein